MILAMLIHRAHAKREENPYSEFHPINISLGSEQTDHFIDIYDVSSLTGVTRLPVFKWHGIPQIRKRLSPIGHPECSK